MAIIDNTTPPTPIPEAPEAPAATHDRAQFVPLAFNFMAWQVRLRNAANTLATNVYQNAQKAFGFAQQSMGFASAAEAARQQAQEAAVLASQAPSASGTSSSSLTIAVGSLTLTTQTQRAFVIGQQVVIARTTNPTSQRMWGVITAYNSETGALTAAVSRILGSGAGTGWTISIGIAPAEGGLMAQRVTVNTAAVPGVHYELATAGITLLMPASAALQSGDAIGFTNVSAGDVNINWQSVKVKGIVPDASFAVPPQGSGHVIYSNTGATWL